MLYTSFVVTRKTQSHIFSSDKLNHDATIARPHYSGKTLRVSFRERERAIVTKLDTGIRKRHQLTLDVFEGYR